MNGVTATYDALGRMVETGSGSSYQQFVSTPDGNPYAIYNAGTSTLIKGTVPLPGGDTAIYNQSGLSYLRHTDWLGSSRLATTWAHAVYSKTAYAPFGETYNEAGTADRSFTGQDQDVVSGSGGTGAYDFLYRKHDPSAGRWLSPDPSGWKAVNLAYPQSLNRFAYLQNSPLLMIDPYGLDPCDEGESTEGGYDLGPCGDGGLDYAGPQPAGDTPPQGFYPVGINPNDGRTIYMDQFGNIWLGDSAGASIGTSPDTNPGGNIFAPWFSQFTTAITTVQSQVNQTVQQFQPLIFGLEHPTKEFCHEVNSDANIYGGVATLTGIVAAADPEPISKAGFAAVTLGLGGAAAIMKIYVGVKC